MAPAAWRQYGRLPRRLAPGIGDVTLLGQWRFFNNQATRTEAALLFGVKAPTGRDQPHRRAGRAVRDRVPAGLAARGTCCSARPSPSASAHGRSTRNVLGVIAGQAARRRPTSATASSTTPRCPTGWSAMRRSRSGRRRSALCRSRCRTARCRIATRHPLDKVAGHAAGPSGPSTLVLELNGEWHDYETHRRRQGTELRRHTCCCSSPGLRVSRGAFSGFASVGIPIVNQMNGVQSKTELSRAHRHRLCVRGAAMRSGEIEYCVARGLGARGQPRRRIRTSSRASRSCIPGASKRATPQNRLRCS